MCDCVVLISFNILHIFCRFFCCYRKIAISDKLLIFISFLWSWSWKKSKVLVLKNLEGLGLAGDGLNYLTDCSAPPSCRHSVYVFCSIWHEIFPTCVCVVVTSERLNNENDIIMASRQTYTRSHSVMTLGRRLFSKHLLQMWLWHHKYLWIAYKSWKNALPNQRWGSIKW